MGFSVVLYKKAQVIMGTYDVYVDSKDTNEVHKILRSSKSTQEFLFEMSKLKKVSRSELHFTGESKLLTQNLKKILGILLMDFTIQ